MFNKRIAPEKVVELFNSMLAGTGKIKKCPGFFLPASVVHDLVVITAHQKFNELETWVEYFTIVKNSTFLTTVFTPSLAWLAKEENAFKVFSGQYDNRDVTKSAENASNVSLEALEMSSRLYERIVQAGNSNLMALLKDLDAKDKMAIEIFGRASEILNCSDYQSSEIKTRLKNAFVKVLTQNLSDRPPLSLISE